MARDRLHDRTLPPGGGVVAAAVAWGTAAVLAHRLPEPMGLLSSASLVAAAAGAWVLTGWRWPLWFVVGALWTTVHVHARLADWLPAERHGDDFAVTGWVDGFPKHAPGQVGFPFRVTSAELPETVPGRLRLTWYEPPPQAVRPGAAFDLVVRLRRPRGLVNPGGFDYARWLFQEGYGATGYVREGRAAAQPPGGAARRWLRFRARLAAAIAATAATGDAAVLQTALTVGERSGFEDSHWRTLQRTGASHLVAISGLHVGLVAGLAFVLGRRIALRLPAAAAVRNAELAAWASLAAAGLYAALAGFTLPTQRALIMLCVAQLALVGRRSVDMSSGLAAAALLVLAWDPAAPLSASFWLSFIAVALLWQLARSEYSRGARRDVRRYAAGLVRVQWYMSLGLVPVTALFFAQVSLVSPLVNMVAIPWFSFVLVPLSLFAAAAVHLPLAGAHLAALAGAPLQWTWHVLAAVGEWSWASVALASPPAWALAIAGLGTAAAMAAWPLPARNLAWLALAPILWWEPARPARGGVVVDILDVGHGLAILVETRSRTLLYDAGARSRSGFDTGRDIVLPAMQAKSWDRLDMLMVSHADNDHIGGAAAVLDAFPDARVVMGPDVDLPGGEFCRRGQAWEWDRVRFSILHPGEAFPARGNDSSCVLRIESPAGSVLLTGDVEAAGERALLADAAALSSDVVVAPHHGSATSSSAALVAAVAPDYAIFSAGYRNHWGFPRPQVAGRWRDAGATLMSTGDTGAVTVTIEPGEPLRVEGRRSRQRRHWNHGD